jgi:integrase
MARALTIISVEKASPNGRRVEIPDGGLQGLYLVIQPSGAKSWAYRYRLNGKTRKYTIGAFPKVDLVNARKLARDAVTAVGEGRDPGVEKKATRHGSGTAPTTLVDLAERFLQRYARRHTRERTWRETARILGFKPDPKDPEKLIRTGDGVASTWKGKAIAEIKRADVVELINQIVDRGSPKMANRTLAWLRKMFAWATSQDIETLCPCVGVKSPVPETERDRVLSDGELKSIWETCDRIGQPFGPLTKLLILTAQRRDEVAAMRWSELDLKRRKWMIPRERVKNERPHEVPLSDAAIAVIKTVNRVKSRDDFVFTTTGISAVSGFSRAKRRLDEKIKELNGEPLEHWTFHDLRRTAATGLEKLHVPLPVTEAVLNHISGSKGGIVGIYQRYEYTDEKREALDKWAGHVEKLISNKATGKVARFRRQPLNLRIKDEAIC